MKYYTINESTAKVAKEINSFSEYKANEATNEYKSQIDELYAVCEEIKEKKPRNYDKALYMVDRYARKYADYLNAYYRNEASCPSVLICGAGNFPTRKKAKQNARRDTLHNEYNYLEAYARRIKSLLYYDAPIKASDDDAIERLEDKISDLEASRDLMKAINVHYRKFGNMEDFELDIPDTLQHHIDFRIKNNLVFGTSLFDTSNTNAELRRCKQRLEKLKELKSQETTETETELFTIVENTDIMRLQLIFEDKPDETTRNVLKHWGFKWSPSNMAWQRQLTDNAKFALRMVTEELTKGA